MWISMGFYSTYMSLGVLDWIVKDWKKWVWNLACRIKSLSDCGIRQSVLYIYTTGITKIISSIYGNANIMLYTYSLIHEILDSLKFFNERRRKKSSSQMVSLLKFCQNHSFKQNFQIQDSQNCHQTPPKGRAYYGPLRQLVF